MAFVKLGDMNVAHEVMLKENECLIPYIIAHKGLPSDIYDKSCDGIWLLRKYADDLRIYNDLYYTNYESTDVNNWLNSKFLNRFDAVTQKYIKTVKIPYVSSYSGLVKSGADGLKCKAFLLSSAEVGLTKSFNKFTPIDEGSKLDYFRAGVNKNARKRRSTTNSLGDNIGWPLRSPYIDPPTMITQIGSYRDEDADYSVIGSWPDHKFFIRPTLIFDPNYIVTE